MGTSLPKREGDALEKLEKSSDGSGSECRSGHQRSCSARSRIAGGGQTPPRVIDGQINAISRPPSILACVVSDLVCSAAFAGTECNEVERKTMVVPNDGHVWAHDLGHDAHECVLAQVSE